MKDLSEIDLELERLQSLIDNFSEQAAYIISIGAIKNGKDDDFIAKKNIFLEEVDLSEAQLDCFINYKYANEFDSRVENVKARYKKLKREIREIKDSFPK